MKILIGYDGSADADGALQDLEYAGLPAKASALVLCLTTPWEPFSPDGQIPMGFAVAFAEHREEALKASQALAKRAADSLRRRFPGWAVKALAGLDRPANGILAKAEEWKPDLIVLGSHGRSALDRLLLGSVSQNVLHHAGCSVRVTRPRIRPQDGPPRLLVGMDGSETAKAAVAGIAKRAWPEGTEVRAIGVLGPRPTPGILGGEPALAYMAELDSARREELESQVAAAAQILSAAGLRATGMVESGEPRSALVDTAAAWRADCIFLGSRGMGPVRRFLLGSVSSAVASHAPCSVEIVRAAGKKARKAARKAAKKPRQAARKRAQARRGAA